VRNYNVNKKIEDTVTLPW